MDEDMVEKAGEPVQFSLSQSGDRRIQLACFVLGAAVGCAAYVLASQLQFRVLQSVNVTLRDEFVMVPKELPTPVEGA